MQPMYVVGTQNITKHGHKGCKYRTQDIENLCKAKDLGMERFAQCQEKNPPECTCAVLHKGSFYCSCRPRVFIARALKK